MIMDRTNAMAMGYYNERVKNEEIIDRAYHIAQFIS